MYILELLHWIGLCMFSKEWAEKNATVWYCQVGEQDMSDTNQKIVMTTVDV